MKKTTLQEFLTPKRSLVLKTADGRKSRTYQLGHYNLSFHNIIYIEFATDENRDGSQNLVNRLSSNDPTAALKAIYLLVEDKTDFPTFESFTKTLDKYKIPIHEIQLLLTSIFTDSMPNQAKKKIIKYTVQIIILMILAGILYMI